jgi:hypothetical protein
MPTSNLHAPGPDIANRQTKISGDFSDRIGVQFSVFCRSAQAISFGNVDCSLGALVNWRWSYQHDSWRMCDHELVLNDFDEIQLEDG